ncbi:MAG: alpha/beta fold hydrolase [Labilithrix sp.]|nr:alpha/beta fold hydrolase [Labilithrix sp.]
MMTSSFRPPRWLKSPHLQTIGAAAPLFAPPRSHFVKEEETLRVPVGTDGHLHARVWWAASGAPAVVVLHGIAGSKDSHCCVRAAVALHRAGYHVVRLDMRGAGDSVVDAPSLYHAGLTTDLDLVVRHLADDPRIAGVLVLGFSGGGSQALKLAGEWGEAPPAGVLAVASISAPLDYTRVAARMDTLVCLPYRFHVLRGLVDRARAFAQHHPTRAHYRSADLDGIKRFRGYDGSIIVPMHGFDDVDRYYEEASSGPYLGKVRVPTLLIHAEDDPMVPIDSVRPWLAGASSAVRVQLSRHGGHIGWLAGLDEASWIKGWATREALAFFAAHAPARFGEHAASPVVA